MFMAKVMRLETTDFVTGKFDPTKPLWAQVKRSPEMTRAEQDAHMIVYGGRVFANRAGPVGEIVPVQQARAA